MTISPEARWKNADVELANAGIELERAKEGRSKLVALRDKHEAEYSAALQDWSRDRTDKALTRMRDARSQLNTVQELLGEDAAPYAKAEAELERCQSQMAQVEVVGQAIELAGALARQQEHFSDDVQELQRQFVELMDKLRKTADAWDHLHRQQYNLAAEAGLSAEQLQRKVEAWGFDANPLKLVLITNNALVGNMPSQRLFKFPDAADGSDLAQYAKKVIMQGVVSHYNDKQRSNAERERREQPGARRSVQAKSFFTAQDELEEGRELQRLALKQQELEAQRQQEAEEWEDEQDRAYGARPHVAKPTVLRITTVTPAHGQTSPAAASDGLGDDE